MRRPSSVLSGLVLLATLLTVPLGAWAQKLALSFDDGFNPEKLADARELNGRLLLALKNHKLQSILFASGSRVDSQEGMDMVRAWQAAGHAVANHSYSHWNLNKPEVSLTAYLDDIQRNESLLARLPAWSKRYRFPYLKEGSTAAKRDGVRQWLTAQGYQSGAVSIDASDWYYDQRLRAWMAQHPGQEPEAFKQPYIDHLLDRARSYAELARQTLGRDPAHVLLLHTNTINAYFLGDVIVALRAAGWSLIAPDEAYKDAMYSHSPEGLPAGESIVWALARQQGVRGLRYPAESDVYEKPKLDALGL